MPSLLQGTLLAAIFLIPGAISLALALAPRFRSVRHSSLSTRAFGLVVFSVADWLLAIGAYGLLVRDCSTNLTALLLGKEKAIQSLLELPTSIWIGMALLFAASVLTGRLVGIVHSLALTGIAAYTFNLENELPRCPWHHLSDGDATDTEKQDGKKRCKWCCKHCQRHRYLRAAIKLHHKLKSIGLSGLFQPLGAGHWLVILKAAELLQWASADDERIPRIWADVIQGDEVIGDKIGVLYKGVVKHLVCETDGNIVFLLLENPYRWRGHSDQRVPATDSATGTALARHEHNPWRPVEDSKAFALEGKSIRNISFRLLDRQSLRQSDAFWLKARESSSATT